MKHLLLSVAAVIDKSNRKPFNGIIKTLEDFKEAEENREVIIISAKGDFLDQIPAALNPVKIPYNLRGSGTLLIEHLEKKLYRKLDDIIVIGAKDKDMQTARHLKAIFLRADYAKSNNLTETLYVKDYGIPLKTVNSISNFFDAFVSVENPWYCKVKVDAKTTFLALTSANTFSDSGSSARIKDEFREYLKNHKQDFVIPFAYYFIVAAHLMVKDLSGFDFWDIYPSSGKGQTNVDLEYFARKAAHTFGKKFQSERLFIRTENAKVRHSMRALERIKDGCDDQLRTMIINPFYKEKLEGKNVCVIDDFTRHGTSSETVRWMLDKAGVNQILFIAMGKFKANAEYNKYKYAIKGDIFSEFEYEQLSREVVTGKLNPNANKDFIESLRKWI